MVIGSESVDYFVAKRMGLLENLATMMESQVDDKSMTYRKITMVFGNLSMYVSAEKTEFKAFVRRRLFVHFAIQM